MWQNAGGIPKGSIWVVSFNERGDCVATTLRPGHVHSAGHYYHSPFLCNRSSEALTP